MNTKTTTITAAAAATLLVLGLGGSAAAAPTKVGTSVPAAVSVSAKRIAFNHPFRSSAFSNTSVGSGAIFGSATDRRNVALQKHAANINRDSWSIPVYRATASDPTVTVSINANWRQSMRVPSGATTTTGTDGHMTIVQPDGKTAYELWGLKRTSTTTMSAGYLVTTDITGTGTKAGTRAAGVSQLHGLIRAHEVASLNIPHSIAMAIDNDQLKSVNGGTGVWPAHDEDGNSASTYAGAIPMGTMFALPGSVKIDSLGLSPEGKALARALQNYGAHVLDRSGGVAIYAEPKSNATAVARMKADWGKLKNMLRVVTNNTETNVAGGGTRRVAPLPEVSAG